MSGITLIIGIVIVAIIVGVGGWWMLRPGRSNFASKFLRKIFSHPRTQVALLIGEDGIVRKEEYKIPEPGFVVNKEDNGAWHLVNAMMLRITGMQRHVLIFIERNTLPYNPFVTLQPKTLEKINNLDTIAHEATSPMLKNALKNSRNNLIASALVICVCAVVLVFLIFIGFSWWKGGGKLPFFGGS